VPFMTYLMQKNTSIFKETKKKVLRKAILIFIPPNKCYKNRLRICNTKTILVQLCLKLVYVIKYRSHLSWPKKKLNWKSRF
jgi:hypothetical protein